MSDPLKDKWERVVELFTARFSPGDPMDLDGILFTIGLQELQMPHQALRKDHKVDVFHIGICRLLEPYGYYKFVGRDEDGWPHFEVLEALPSLPGGHQARLMREAVVHYCEGQGWI
ncbi:MAG TPA: hypothetical protein DDY62_02475 [Cryomorphaceae bacterium]|jgi:hypothetical protein|nr:hypothetical protein [Cryomorphaceae bacterium]